MKFGWIYKGIYKIEDQMCELNYKGTKIKIGVKLEDQKCNFTYKKWSLYKKSLRRWHVALICDIDTWQSHVALTRDKQRLRLTVNVQFCRNL